MALITQGSIDNLLEHLCMHNIHHCPSNIIAYCHFVHHTQTPADQSSCATPSLKHFFIGTQQTSMFNFFQYSTVGQVSHITSSLKACQTLIIHFKSRLTLVHINCSISVLVPFTYRSLSPDSQIKHTQHPSTSCRLTAHSSSA